MNAWRAYVLGWCGVAGLALATLSFAVWGIWTSDDRGAIAVVFFFTAAIGAFVMTCWSDNAPSRVTKLSRSERQELSRRRRQLQMERETRRMETELGMKHREWD